MVSAIDAIVEKLANSFGGVDNLSRFLRENPEIVIINIVDRIASIEDIHQILSRYWNWTPAFYTEYHSGDPRAESNEPQVYVHTVVNPQNNEQPQLVIVFKVDIEILSRLGVVSNNVYLLDQKIRENVTSRRPNRRVHFDDAQPGNHRAREPPVRMPMLSEQEVQIMYFNLKVDIVLIKLLILQYLNSLPQHLQFASNVSDNLHRDRNIVVVGLDWQFLAYFGGLFIGSTPRAETYDHAVDIHRQGLALSLDTQLIQSEVYGNALQERHVILPYNPNNTTANIEQDDFSQNTHRADHNSHMPAPTTLQDLAQALATTRKSDPSIEIQERDREIKLLQQCLLELEIDYFRMVAENDMFRQQQKVDEEAFIEPWYRHNNALDARNKEFEASERDNATRMRQFQDQVAIKGFGSALDAQNNALSAVAGIAVNQRPYTDSTRFAEAVQQQSKRPATDNIEDAIKRLRNDTDIQPLPSLQPTHPFRFV